MMNTERSIAGPTVLRIAALGVIALVASIQVSEAKPKKLSASQHCTCGCEYQDAEGTWQWGSDVNFTSSDCRQWKNKRQSCMTGDGAVDGRLTMCMPTPKDTEAAVDGGNAGVFDPGNSPPPAGTVGGPSGTILLIPGR